jgi:hypothetical protein
MQWLLAIAALALLSRRSSESTAGSNQSGAPQAGSNQSGAPQAGAPGSEKAIVKQAPAPIDRARAGAEQFVKTVVIVGKVISTLVALGGPYAVIAAMVVVIIAVIVFNLGAQVEFEWRAKRNWLLTTGPDGGPAWRGRKTEVVVARTLILGEYSQKAWWGPVQDVSTEWGEEEYRMPEWNAASGREIGQLGYAVVFARRVKEVQTPRIQIFGNTFQFKARLYASPPPQDPFDIYEWFFWRRNYTEKPPQEWVTACAAVAQSTADGEWLGAAVALALGDNLPLPQPVTVDVYGPGNPRGVFAGGEPPAELPFVPEAHAAGYLHAGLEVYREWALPFGARKFGNVPEDVFRGRLAAAYEQVMGFPLKVPQNA